MPNALVTIFEMLTGSNWFYVMWNGMRVAGMLSSLFFLFWMFLSGSTERNASGGRMEDDGGALGRTGGGPAVGAGPSALYY